MRQIILWIPISLLLGSAAASPADHVVPVEEIERRLQDDAAERRRNVQDIQRLFEAPEAEEALAPAGLEPQQVRQAVPLLDDATLAELAERARALEKDVAGGLIGSLILLLILVLALAIILIVYAD